MVPRRGMVAMSIGWTIEITTERLSSSGPRVRSELFDVAIEDKILALEAARYRARGNIVQIVAKDELAQSTRLSPGRIRPRLNARRVLGNPSEVM
jgi:hypothetical protein